MSTQPKASFRILIVEDDLMVAAMMQEIVSKWGYQVAGPAGDQTSANKLIETTRIDAALISAGLLPAAEDSAANARGADSPCRSSERLPAWAEAPNLQRIAATPATM